MAEKYGIIFCDNLKNNQNVDDNLASKNGLHTDVNVPTELEENENGNDNGKREKTTYTETNMLEIRNNNCELIRRIDELTEMMKQREIDMKVSETNFMLQIRNLNQQISDLMVMINKKDQEITCLRNIHIEKTNARLQTNVSNDPEISSVSTNDNTQQSKEPYERESVTERTTGNINTHTSTPITSTVSMNDVLPLCTTNKTKKRNFR